MKSIVHDGLTYYHFACLSDHAGNSHQPGFWADLWIPEEKDWHDVIQDIVRQVIEQTKGTQQYYNTLSKTLDAFYLEKIKEHSFIVTMGGAWSYYAPNQQLAKQIEKMDNKFLNDTALVKALLADDHEKIFKILKKKG